MVISSDSGKKTPGLKGPKDPSGSPFITPEGFWVKCDGCQAVLQHAQLENNQQVCPDCQHHFRIGARRRLDLFCDPASVKELDAQLTPKDILGFFDSKTYAERLKGAEEKTRFKDAFLSARATLMGRPIQVGSFEFSFMGGSMGTIVGEKIARIFDRAAERREPAVIFSASGGARMQEGLLSLMQMAKTTAALTRMNERGVPYVSVLTDPTTGGVAASFSMIGDVTIAEPGALVGFAGPRVIEQTINQKLPEGFQRSEFLLKHGMIDGIVQRRELREYIDRVFRLLVG